MEDALWLLLAVQVVFNLLLVSNVVSMRKRFEDSLGSTSYSERTILDRLNACEGAIRNTAGSAEEIKEHMEALRLKFITFPSNLDSRLSSIDRGVRLRGLDETDSTIESINSHLASIRTGLGNLKSLDSISTDLEYIREGLMGISDQLDPDFQKHKFEEERYIKHSRFRGRED